MAKTNTQRWRQIDQVPIKLKQSKLYKESNYATLIDSIIDIVIPFWNNKWRFKQEFNGILNKKKINAEIEESIPVLSFVLEMIDNIINSNGNNKDKLSIPIIDLCSGKGILSMLIISFIKLVPKYQSLFKYLNCIYLLDRNWDLHFIEIEELKLRNQDPTKQAKCPIKSGHLALLSQEFKIELKPIRTDIHNKKIIQFLSQINNDENCKIIFMAIHLCRRLSVRAIQLFNINKNIKGFILAPCCLPLAGSNNIKIGPIYNKTYNLWKSNNINNIDNINNQYLIKGIINNDDDNKDDDDDDDESTCCYNLSLMSYKQIDERSKRMINKFKLSQNDINKLKKCNDDYNEISKQESMFITSQLCPRYLHDLDKNKRYNQWINFLYNSIDSNDDKKMCYRVALTSKDQHRCDCYISAQRI